MGYKKRDLILHIKRCKGIIKHLKKLQGLMWSPNDKPIYYYIAIYEGELRGFKRGLKNGEYFEAERRRI